MEIRFPDVADVGNRGLSLEQGTETIRLKASEGTTFTDPSYQGFRAQAAQLGIFQTAYHWLWPGNIQAQAAHAWSIIGPGVETMLDVEEIRAVPTVAEICGFVAWYRKLGGTCKELYLPHWYWANNMGSPDLTPCVSMGLLLVASDYRPYDPNNWPAGYGGMPVDQWQYTNAQPYGGQLVDFNARRGTLSDYITAVLGTPTPPPPPVPKGDPILMHWTSVQRGDKGSQVSKAQGVLIGNGLPVGSHDGLPDGDFGPTTEASTRHLQQDHGITVDGIFGPHTLSVGLYGHDYA